MASPMTLNQFQMVLDKNFRSIQEGKFTQYQSGMLEKYYKHMNSDEAYVQFGEIGNLPDVRAFNGAIEYVSQSPGYTTKIEPKEYALGTMFERKLLDTKRFPVMEGRVGKLGESVARTRDKTAHKPFTQAFSAAFDYMQTEEGIALCGAHTTRTPSVSTSSGFTNNGTSSLNKTSILAGSITMSRFRDQDGERINMTPDPVVVVPMALYQQACEAVGYNPRTGEKSALDPDSANNKINFAGGLRVEVLPRLDDDSTKNWYLVDWNKMKEHLIWIDRVKAEFNTTIDFESLVVKSSVYASWGYGWTAWQWIHGNNVS